MIKTLYVSSFLTLIAMSCCAQEGMKNVTLLGIPSATTAPAGVVFGQVSRTVDINSDSEERTVLAFGAGFGNASDSIGVQGDGNWRAQIR